MARWTDNFPLVATKQITVGRVVGLNMFPPSNGFSDDFWNAATDGTRLIANSLLFAGRQFAPGVSPTEEQIIISEFRARGPGGSKDEFIELYNNTDSDITVNVNNTDFYAGLTTIIAQVGTGCSGNLFLAAPNGTFIPARGHYLVTNSQYSLGTLAPSDNNPFSAFNYDMPDNTALTLVKFEGTRNTKLDTVGFGTNNCDGSLSEGTSLTPIDTAVGAFDQYSFVRKLDSGLPQDTNDNASDFALVSPTAFVGSAPATLGAAGPQNSSSPLQRNATIKGSLVDPNCAGAGSTTSACSRVRTAEGANSTNSAYGQLRIRRKFFNKTGANVTRLRFRITGITTTPETGVADLRDVGGTGSFAANVVGGGTATIQRLTLEQPPTQALGGGLNSTLAAGTITLSSQLIANDSINVEFILGVMRDGSYRFFVNVEALP